MTHTEARKLLDTYGIAWVTQDPKLILTIFTPDATYDDPHEPKNIGRESIQKYWMSKVVEQQKDITFKILNIWVDGDFVITDGREKIFTIEQEKETYELQRFRVDFLIV